MKLSKSLINKYVIVDWLDPKTITRGELNGVDFAKPQTNGKVVKVSPYFIILEHENVEELGDYTIIHKGLIQKLKILK